MLVDMSVTCTKQCFSIHSNWSPISWSPCSQTPSTHNRLSVHIKAYQRQMVKLEFSSRSSEAHSFVWNANHLQPTWTPNPCGGRLQTSWNRCPASEQITYESWSVAPCRFVPLHMLAVESQLLWLSLQLPCMAKRKSMGCKHHYEGHVNLHWVNSKHHFLWICDNHTDNDVPRACGLIGVRLSPVCWLALKTILRFAELGQQTQRSSQRLRNGQSFTWETKRERERDQKRETQWDTERQNNRDRDKTRRMWSTWVNSMWSFSSCANENNMKYWLSADILSPNSTILNSSFIRWLPHSNTTTLDHKLWILRLMFVHTLKPENLHGESPVTSQQYRESAERKIKQQEVQRSWIWIPCSQTFYSASFLVSGWARRVSHWKGPRKKQKENSDVNRYFVQRENIFLLVRKEIVFSSTCPRQRDSRRDSDFVRGKGEIKR